MGVLLHQPGPCSCPSAGLAAPQGTLAPSGNAPKGAAGPADSRHSWCPTARARGWPELPQGGFNAAVGLGCSVTPASCRQFPFLPKSCCCSLGSTAELQAGLSSWVCGRDTIPGTSFPVPSCSITYGQNNTVAVPTPSLGMCPESFHYLHPLPILLDLLASKEETALTDLGTGVWGSLTGCWYDQVIAPRKCHPCVNSVCVSLCHPSMALVVPPPCLCVFVCVCVTLVWLWQCHPCVCVCVLLRVPMSCLFNPVWEAAEFPLQRREALSPPTQKSRNSTPLPGQGTAISSD